MKALLVDTPSSLFSVNTFLSPSLLQPFAHSILTLYKKDRVRIPQTDIVEWFPVLNPLCKDSHRPHLCNDEDVLFFFLT